MLLFCFLTNFLSFAFLQIRNKIILFSNKTETPSFIFVIRRVVVNYEDEESMIIAFVDFYKVTLSEENGLLCVSTTVNKVENLRTTKQEIKILNTTLRIKKVFDFSSSNQKNCLTIEFETETTVLQENEVLNISFSDINFVLFSAQFERNKEKLKQVLGDLDYMFFQLEKPVTKSVSNESQEMVYVVLLVSSVFVILLMSFAVKKTFTYKSKQNTTN